MNARGLTEKLDFIVLRRKMWNKKKFYYKIHLTGSDWKIIRFMLKKLVKVVKSLKKLNND